MVTRTQVNPPSAGKTSPHVGSAMITCLASRVDLTRSMAPNPPASSSTTLWTARRPSSSIPASRMACAAAIHAARPPFMSTAPRPHIQPCSICAPNGSRCQADESPTGTTSMCPHRIRLFSSMPCHSPITLGRSGKTSQLSVAKSLSSSVERTKICASDSRFNA